MVNCHLQWWLTPSKGVGESCCPPPLEECSGRPLVHIPDPLNFSLESAFVGYPTRRLHTKPLSCPQRLDGSISHSFVSVRPTPELKYSDCCWQTDGQADQHTHVVLDNVLVWEFLILMSINPRDFINRIREDPYLPNHHPWVCPAGWWACSSAKPRPPAGGAFSLIGYSSWKTRSAPHVWLDISASCNFRKLANPLEAEWFLGVDLYNIGRKVEAFYNNPCLRKSIKLLTKVKVLFILWPLPDESPYDHIHWPQSGTY